MDTITTNVERSKSLPEPFFEKRALRAILEKAIVLLKEAHYASDVHLVAASISSCLDECYDTDDDVATSALQNHAEEVKAFYFNDTSPISANNPHVAMFIVAIEEFLK